MKIFVASWFFPPSTSSEGIVTYKLLRNSKHQYDVFSAVSDQWGYSVKTDLKYDRNNVTNYYIRTDDVRKWMRACVRKFEELHRLQKYDCIMTRSMPPESICVGSEIKKRHPGIKWIASMADPIANNPYELDAYVDGSNFLSAGQKVMVKKALRTGDAELLEHWEKRPEKSIRLLCKLKRWEMLVLRQADMIVCPTAEQIRYMLGKDAWNPKCVVIPHSYDLGLFPKKIRRTDSDKIKFLFIGYSDNKRSLKPVIEAVRKLKEEGSAATEKIQIDIVGNNPRNLWDMVLNYYLDDVIHFHKGVDYYESLRLMQQTDWLVHIDAFFPDLAPEGSIFFAGKLADYFGTDKPVLALTGNSSPAGRMVKLAGGAVCQSRRSGDIAPIFADIAIGGRKPEVNRGYRDSFSSERVAGIFDQKIQEVCFGAGTARRPKSNGSHKIKSKNEKILSICVPAYNAERYLARCIRSLMDHSFASYEEVLVIDDGSTDVTAQIAGVFEKEYPGIVKLVSKENGGHGSAINTAIAEAQGKYFRVVDSDDWVDGNVLGELIRKIKDGIYQEDIISSNYEEIDINTGTATTVAPDEGVAFDRSYHFAELSPEKYYFTLASMTIRTRILKERHIRLQENTYYVDCEYILFPIPYVKKFVFSESSLYRYSRGSTEQSVDLGNMVMRYDHHSRVVHSLLEYSLRMDASKEQRAYFDTVMLKIIKTHYALMLVYDEKTDRGFRRAKEFDGYLKRIRPDMYDEIKKKVPLTRIVQLGGYSDRSAVYRLWQIAEKEYKALKSRGVILKERVLHSDLFHRTLYNSVTRTIYGMDFVKKGYRKYIKNKL